MKQITILRNSQITNQASFETQEEAQAWLDSHLSMGSFGRPRFEMQNVEVSPAVIESQEILDEGGVSFDPPQFQNVEVSPAVFEEQLVETNPSGYEISMVDTTAEVEQAEINAEALKYLADTDWVIIRELDSGEPCPLDIKTERAAARTRIV